MAAGVPRIDLHTFTQALADPQDPAAIFCDHVHFRPDISAAQGHWLAGLITAHLQGLATPA